MDNQPMNLSQQPQSPMSSSGLKTGIVILVIVLAAAAFVAWYRSSRIASYAPLVAPSVSQPSGVSALSPGDTTADIANDLNKTLDDTAATGEMNLLDQNLKSF